MDIATSVYNLREIPENIINKITNDRNYMNQLLGLEDFNDQTLSSKGYLGNFYPETKLNREVINNISEYIKKLLDVDKDISKLYTKSIYSNDFRVQKILLNTRNLMLEQYQYLNYKIEDEKNCEIFFIASFVNDFIYGGIFVFWNTENPDSLLIQGISKYVEPIMISIFLSDLDKKLPRLNSLLQPAVEALARKLGVGKIFVSPLKQQGDILVKHYGYKKINKIYFPCKNIFKSGFMSDELYVKYIEE